MLYMDLDAVADGLYGLRPSEFISARTLRASEAKQAGDRQLAASIASLKRPTKSAWLVNVLVRQCREHLNELLELGENMRVAQDRLAGEQLRGIARRRLEVESALTQLARQIAGDAGELVSDEMARELGATLEAAFADPAARDAVRRGRLTVALDYSGFGGIDQTTNAQQRPRALGKARGSARRITAAGGEKSPDSAERRRNAQSVLSEAQANLARAQKEMKNQDQAVARAGKEQARLDQRIADLEAGLSRLVDEASRSADESLAAQQLRDAAQSTLRVAEERRRRANQELDGL